MLRLLMSAILTLVAVTLLAAPTAWAADKEPVKKDDPKNGRAEHITWDTKEFEIAIQTEFGLKMKSISLQPAEIKGNFSEPEKVKILLEFDKDANYDLTKIKDSFGGLRTVINYNKNRVGSSDLGGGRLELLYYDEESVRMGKASRGSIEGEITGKKGEAFRVWVRLEAKIQTNVRRIEVRLHPRHDLLRDNESTAITKAIKWETEEFQKTLESDYGLKLKSVAVVSIGKERHIMLECERTKLEKDVKGRSFNLAGFFDRPFKKSSGGIECQFLGADDSLLATVKVTNDAAACCVDEPSRLVSVEDMVGGPVTIFVRSPGDTVLMMSKKAVFRITAPEKEK